MAMSGSFPFSSPGTFFHALKAPALSSRIPDNFPEFEKQLLDARKRRRSRSDQACSLLLWFLLWFPLWLWLWV